jgi:hypothetical protein
MPGVPLEEFVLAERDEQARAAPVECKPDGDDKRHRIYDGSGLVSRAAMACRFHEKTEAAGLPMRATRGRPIF